MSRLIHTVVSFQSTQKKENTIQTILDMFIRSLIVKTKLILESLVFVVLNLTTEHFAMKDLLE